MSLINDALKKAQNRHGDSTPPTGLAGPAAIPANPRKGKSPFGKIVLIGASIALLSTAVSVTVILLVVRKDEPTPPPVAPATPPSSPVQPAPVTPPVSTTTTPPVTPSPVTPPPVPEKNVQPAPVTPTVSLPPPEPTAPAIKLGTRIQSFIDRLRVTSIRISDTGNKVILNDRLFRTNDLVEPSLGLRLTDIQANQLTFTDESGNSYVRHF
ncbi:MAG: hypothetical protein QM760_15585 [Nibricoccus sp.]